MKLTEVAVNRLRAIKYFIAVVEHSNFTRAAKALGVPASSVSRQLQELESNLGVALVHRTTRAVSLTELGAVYLDQVRPAVAALKHADELMRANPERPAGVLRITAIPDYGRHYVMPAMVKFKARYPEIILDIELADQVLNLASHEVDLAIRATAVLPERSVAKKLSDNQFILVASPRYIARHGRPEKLAELEHHQTMLYRHPNGLLHWQAKTANGWKEIHPPQSYISNQGEALVEQALAGEGIALVPAWGVLESLAEGRLLKLELNDADISVSRNPNPAIYLLYQQSKYRLKKIQVAVEFLMAELAAESVTDSTLSQH
jgi:DNA-binding transcriptional LysR family regulator